MVEKTLPLSHVSLCPEYDYRQSLSDGDFWEHVFNGGLPEMLFEEPETDEYIMAPCIHCGSVGACGYDEQGRAMIHCLDSDD